MFTSLPATSILTNTLSKTTSPHALPHLSRRLSTLARFRVSSKPSHSPFPLLTRPPTPGTCLPTRFFASKSTTDITKTDTMGPKLKRQGQTLKNPRLNAANPNTKTSSSTAPPLGSIKPKKPHTTTNNTSQHQDDPIQSFKVHRKLSMNTQHPVDAIYPPKLNRRVSFGQFLAGTSLTILASLLAGYVYYLKFQSKLFVAKLCHVQGGAEMYARDNMLGDFLAKPLDFSTPSQAQCQRIDFSASASDSNPASNKASTIYAKVFDLFGSICTTPAEFQPIALQNLFIMNKLAPQLEEAQIYLHTMLTHDIADLVNKNPHLTPAEKLHITHELLAPFKDWHTHLTSLQRDIDRVSLCIAWFYRLPISKLFNPLGVNLVSTSGRSHGDFYNNYHKLSPNPQLSLFQPSDPTQPPSFLSKFIHNFVINYVYYTSSDSIVQAKQLLRIVNNAAICLNSYCSSEWNNDTTQYIASKDNNNHNNNIPQNNPNSFQTQSDPHSTTPIIDMAARHDEIQRPSFFQLFAYFDQEAETDQLLSPPSYINNTPNTVKTSDQSKPIYFDQVFEYPQLTPTVAPSLAKTSFFSLHPPNFPFFESSIHQLPPSQHFAITSQTLSPAELSSLQFPPISHFLSINPAHLNLSTPPPPPPHPDAITPLKHNQSEQNQIITPSNINAFQHRVQFAPKTGQLLAFSRYIPMPQFPSINFEPFLPALQHLRKLKQAKYDAVQKITDPQAELAFLQHQWLQEYQRNHQQNSTKPSSIQDQQQQQQQQQRTSPSTSSSTLQDSFLHHQHQHTPPLLAQPFMPVLPPQSQSKEAEERRR